MNDKKHELQINLELLQPILSWFTKQTDINSLKNLTRKTKATYFRIWNLNQFLDKTINLPLSTGRNLCLALIWRWSDMISCSENHNLNINHILEKSLCHLILNVPFSVHFSYLHFWRARVKGIFFALANVNLYNLY